MIFGLFLVIFAAALIAAAAWFVLGLIHDHDPGDMPLFRQSAVLLPLAVEIPYTHTEWLPRNLEIHHPGKCSQLDGPRTDGRAGDPAATAWSRRDARELAARLDFDRLLRQHRPVTS